MSAPPPVELPNHDILSQLARDDPQAYEALRREVIDSFIDRAPARIQGRLRGIQFRVDNERRLSHSALGSTVRIYKLMWNSFLHLNQGWQDFVHMKVGRGKAHGTMMASKFVPKGSARILEFRRFSLGEQ